MFKRHCVAGRVRGHSSVGRSEYSLASKVGRVGPMAIAADVSGRTFGYVTVYAFKRSLLRYIKTIRKK